MSDIATASELHCTGTFEVKLEPQAPTGGAIAAAIGRMSLDKRFHGELDATSAGEMISIKTDANGSAAYVALERVTGALGHVTGTFVLMHAGTMLGSEFHLSVTVVPGSGTGQLEGLSGRMDIRIVEKQHFYDFDYSFGRAAAQVSDR